MSYHTVNSLLFVEYQFSWISWELVNQEIKCSRNNKCSIGVYADFCKTTKFNIYEQL